MNRVITLSLAGIAAALILVVVLFLSTSDSQIGEKSKSFSDLGGDFTLQSHAGRISLSDFKGGVVVMYFGFLTCPEVCPNSMTVIQTALNRLEPSEQAATKALLVSVDPKRDTLSELAEYAHFYHDRLTGLTGTTSEIDQVTRQYGAFYDFTEIETATADYGVEHSSRYYVIDRGGKLVAAMRHSTTPNELVAQIRELL